MRRKVKASEERPDPPDWCRTLLSGLRYAAEAGHRGLAVQMSFLRAQRASWCRRNGCYRRGRTCNQLFGRSCGDVKEN